MLRQFSEIEEKYGFILIDGSLKKEYTQEEVLELLKSGKAIGVNHTDRIKFLNDNGYDITRDIS